VLLIACINFTNLATARSARRAREVGLRKVLGAERSRLTRQFLGEAVIFSLAGLALAVVVVELSAPFVSALAGVKLRMDFIRIPWLPFALFGLALFTGLTSGAYPAFVLSAYMPHRVLKDGFRSGRGGRRMRQVLVVSQFMVSAALIIGSTMIMNQLRYMKNKPAGFDREQVVAIRMLDAETRRAAEVFKRDFVTHPGVIAAAAGSSLPGSGVVSNSKIPEGRTLATNVLMDEINVDQDYLPTLGMELTAGRNFSLEFSTDIGGAVIINQSAARSLGWEDPIGKTIRSSRLGQGWVPMKVIGVVKDFHQRPMDQAIRPLFIGFYPPHSQSWGVFDLLLVRIRPDDMPETLAFLEDRWRELARQAPFDWFFLDEAFNRQFRNLERSRDIFSTFTFLGIFVACLGLFGMASYSAERRSREIGIRKVLGGSVPGLTMLLCRELGGLILLGNVIAWPLAYLILRHWLRQFPYRIGIGPLPFLLSTSLVLSLGLAVIAYQAVRAATTDPVKTLRYE